MESENWDQQLKEAEVEELVGTDTWIAVNQLPEFGKSYANITGETAKFYKVTLCPIYALQQANNNIDEVPQMYLNSQRIKKDTLIKAIVFPIETL